MLPNTIEDPRSTGNNERRDAEAAQTGRLKRQIPIQLHACGHSKEMRRLNECRYVLDLQRQVIHNLRNRFRLCIFGPCRVYRGDASDGRRHKERVKHVVLKYLFKGGAMTESITLMTVEEVAKLLHYSTKTVYKKAARGEIPSVPVSRRKRLFSRDAVIYWLTNKQVGKL
jgi:excisionase family DNA binding protein